MLDNAIGDSMSPINHDGPASLLIIEDSPLHRTVICRIGDKIGFTTTDADSFEAAAKLLQERGFDCITLDLSLGEHAGVEVLRLLADIRSTTPIIIISGSDYHVLDEACKIAQTLNLNICKPLHKPVNLTLLREMLEQIRIGSGQTAIRP